MNLSESIRFGFVTNEQGKIVQSKVSSNAFLLDREQVSLLGVDLQILRKILKMYDDIIGQSTSLHMVRDKVHVLIFYVGEWTILVSCNRDTDRHVLADLSEHIGGLLQEASSGEKC